MGQRIFSSANYTFAWVGDWYEWDGKEARKQAMAARSAFCKELKRDGIPFRIFSESSQLVRRGGIGSGHPEIDLVCSMYGVNY